MCLKLAALVALAVPKAGVLDCALPVGETATGSLSANDLRAKTGSEYRICCDVHQSYRKLMVNQNKNDTRGCQCARASKFLTNAIDDTVTLACVDQIHQYPPGYSPLHRCSCQCGPSVHRRSLEPQRDWRLHGIASAQRNIRSTAKS